MTHQRKEMTVRGLKTAWLEAGTAEKPILLLLHGFPDTADCWEHQIEGFAASYQVIAPYVRGAGPSEPATELRRYGRDAVALDILAILDAVDPTRERPVYVVGHDVGAVHAWHVASLLRGRARRLVVINGLTIRQMARRLDSPRQLVRSWYIFLMQMPRVPEFLLRRFPRPLLSFAHGKGGLAAEQRPALDQVKDALTAPLNQYRAFMRELPRRVMAKDPQPACPVLVLWGSDDAFVLPPTKDELAGEARDLTVRIVRGNHWLQREQPERVNRLLGDFFEGAVS